MARADSNLIFALLAGAGILGAVLWTTGALAKPPPWITIVKGADGKDILIMGGKCYNETGTLITCPTGTTTYCPTGQHLVGNACVADTVVPPPVTTSTVDNFDTANYILNAGAVSPNGLWKGVYTSGGILQQVGGVLRLEPAAVSSASQTSAPLVSTVKEYANFDATFKMRTIAQLRTGTPPNNWETAWVIFRAYSGDIVHAYAFLIKMSGLQLEKKDNAPGNTAPEDELFLATPSYPNLVLGQWYDVRINMVGWHIQIWVNGAKVIDFTDNDVHDPVKMAKGTIGFYSEDARVEFDNVNIVALP